MMWSLFGGIALGTFSVVFNINFFEPAANASSLFVVSIVFFTRSLTAETAAPFSYTWAWSAICFISETTCKCFACLPWWRQSDRAYHGWPFAGTADFYGVASEVGWSGHFRFHRILRYWSHRLDLAHFPSVCVLAYLWHLTVTRIALASSSGNLVIVFITASNSLNFSLH